MRQDQTANVELWQYKRQFVSEISHTSTNLLTSASPAVKASFCFPVFHDMRAASALLLNWSRTVRWRDCLISFTEWHGNNQSCNVSRVWSLFECKTKHNNMNHFVQTLSPMLKQIILQKTQCSWIRQRHAFHITSLLGHLWTRNNFADNNGCSQIVQPHVF